MPLACLVGSWGCCVLDVEIIHQTKLALLWPSDVEGRAPVIGDGALSGQGLRS